MSQQSYEKSRAEQKNYFSFLCRDEVSSQSIHLCKTTSSKFNMYPFGYSFLKTRITEPHRQDESIATNWKKRRFPLSNATEKTSPILVTILYVIVLSLLDFHHRILLL